MSTFRYGVPMYSSRSSGARRLCALLGLGALTLTGCGFWDSSPAPGPVPPPPPLPSPSPARASLAPAPLPPRPYDLNLQGIDPCKLLTEQQRGELGFDRQPLPDSDADAGDAATCSFRNTTAKVGARIALITNEGMQVWSDNTTHVDTTPVAIDDFPGVVAKTQGLDLTCSVEVDVASGQHLDVLYRDDGGQPPPPVDQLCAGAQRVATATVHTLKAPPGPLTSTPFQQMPTNPPQ